MSRLLQLLIAFANAWRRQLAAFKRHLESRS
jgi:hypothetical protein